MKSLRNAMENTGQLEGGGIRPSVLQRVRGLFGKERIAVDQEALSDSIGKVAIVGDFGYNPGEQLRAGTARRVVRVLRSSGIVETGVPVDIRTMVPDIAEGDSDKSLDTSMDMLATTLREVGSSEQHLYHDPIAVAVKDRKRLGFHAYAGLSNAAPERGNGSSDRSLVVVANPLFISHAFPNLKYHHMEAGGVAVLAEVGENPEANRFVQVWPNAPSAHEEAV